AGRQALPKHLRGLAEWKGSARKPAGVGTAEVWMIQNVEHLGAKLQLDFLSNRKVTVHREIPLGCAESSQHIAPQVAITKRSERGRIKRRIRERSRVDRLAAGILRSIKIEGLPGNDIRPNIRVSTVDGVKIDVGNVNRSRRPSLYHVFDRPAFQNRICYGV